MVAALLAVMMGGVGVGGMGGQGPGVAQVMPAQPGEAAPADGDGDTPKTTPASSDQGNDKAPVHARATLVCETDVVHPGQSANLGLHFEIDDGWHLYWDGRNDSGMPITVDWKLPKEVTKGAMEWPAPIRHISPGNILDHVYTHEVTLILPIEIGKDVEPGTTLTVHANVDWLVCSTMCVPESGSLDVQLPVREVGDNGNPWEGRPQPPMDRAEAESPVAGWFRDARARLAKPWPTDGAMTAQWSDQMATIHVDGARGLVFYPDKDCVDLLDPINDCEELADELVLNTATDDPVPSVDNPDARVVPELSGIVEVQMRGDYPSAFYHLRLKEGTSLPVATPDRGTDGAAGGGADDTDKDR